MGTKIAMGTKMGPSYANLFVGYVEHKFFNQYNGPKPELYRRYIDDCIGATSSSREDLNQFITAVNSFHPALKYTWEISDTSLAFLDIKVSIEGNRLCTSVYYKPTDSHSYLLYSSSHPSHVKNSIPVELPQGVLRRNRIHLRKTYQPAPNTNVSQPEQCNEPQPQEPTEPVTEIKELPSQAAVEVPTEVPPTVPATPGKAPVPRRSQRVRRAPKYEEDYVSA